MAKRNGPSALIVLHCDGCMHLRSEKLLLRIRKRQPGLSHDCMATGRPRHIGLTTGTPNWCPLKDQALCAMVQSRVRWRTGFPTVEEVQAHETAHPLRGPHQLGDPNGSYFGGIWMAIDPDSPFAAAPHHMRLRIARPGENILCVDDARPYTPVDVTGKILLGNGWTMWQLLETCSWAARARYTPVTVEGTPVWLMDGGIA